MRSAIAGLENASVLLVDLDPHTCEARAQAFRNRGVIVDCAQDIAAARTRYQAGVYNLVLVDLSGDVAGAQQFASSIQAENPRQKVAFLLGVPPYVALAPGSKGAARRAAPQMRTAPAQASTSSDFGRRIREAESKSEKPGS